MPIAFKHKLGLVAYITCGDPSLEVSRDVALAAIRAGAEVIELGVPFSDPVADGPVIQRASERALRQGTNLDSVLQVAREIREQSNAGIIIFSYMNPILQFGIDRFCASVAAAGADGALVTDLPVEEAGDYLRAIKGRRLAPIFSPRPPAPTNGYALSRGIRVASSMPSRAPESRAHGKRSPAMRASWLRGFASSRVCPSRWDLASPTPTSSLKSAPSLTLRLWEALSYREWKKIRGARRKRFRSSCRRLRIPGRRELRARTLPRSSSVN